MFTSGLLKKYHGRIVQRLTDNLRGVFLPSCVNRPDRYQLVTKCGLLQNQYPTRETLLRVPSTTHESDSAGGYLSDDKEKFPYTQWSLTVQLSVCLVIAGDSVPLQEESISVIVTEREQLPIADSKFLFLWASN